jgi:hypothetical protein
MSHLAEASTCEVVCLDPDFSSFDFVDRRFSGSDPIRKLFSISRGRGGRTLIIEKVKASGHLAEENEDLARIDEGFKALELYRLSFWKEAVKADELDRLTNDGCIGYALLKKDRLTSHGDEWHVYEAVLQPYPHSHTYVNARSGFPFQAAGRQFRVEGCLYAQQNKVNKTCAQVAIRSIVATYFGVNEISYRRINELAGAGSDGFNPAEGLTDIQTGKVLKGLGVNFRVFQYRKRTKARSKSKKQPDDRDELPYQKVLYSGIENGCGALMSFNLSGPKARRGIGHMIPFFGHTFNEDSWVPNAEPTYFKVGEAFRYIPSRSWLSNFLVHDDNFGANLCIPQMFIDKERVSSVFELLPQDWVYSGYVAEFTAAYYINSILQKLPTEPDLPWLLRLRNYADNERLVFRHVPVSKDEYLASLTTEKDWHGNHESPETVAAFRARLPGEHYWMIEVSVPEVFSMNKRKVGEILLDAGHELDVESDSNFIMARLPGHFVFLQAVDANGSPSFSFSPNVFTSHTRLICKGTPEGS